VTAPLPTRREALLGRLEAGPSWDLAVVGGGATGLAVALMASLRGLRVVLVEAHDFAKGTSSRSTKLVHGGVRYLAQGHFGLVREALHERMRLLRGAPHLVAPLDFVLPARAWWEMPFYGAGLMLYDTLAGRDRLARTAWLGPQAVVDALPGLSALGWRGGVCYQDAQFDDARLALAMARTAASHGALVVNYCRTISLLHVAGRVAGLVCEDRESGRRFEIQAANVVNATGVWSDDVRRLDAVVSGTPVDDAVTPSQGVHLVVDATFLPGTKALLVPRTADGRVLFAVPWLGKVILGTTDTPRHDRPLEPEALDDEVAFILAETGRYLRRQPTAADVRSVWAGLRPLARTDPTAKTAQLGREHAVEVAPSGLVSVTGGKWTTCLAIAEDVLDRCAHPKNNYGTTAGVSAPVSMVGASPGTGQRSALGQPPGVWLYGSEASFVEGLPGPDRWLTEGLSEAMVRFAVRYEYARRVEDVLARRSRLLFLDARKAADLAPAVGRLVQEETGCDPDVAGFLDLSARYSLA
jgi:glycerol-3-phosphate dehydrogenase